ncbi:Nn.00g014740.m01.CDS01 [Neocucurbitaria sp. VM-36]
MLQYMGTRQPPRKYPIPEEQSTSSAGKQLCSICIERTWTPKLFSKLANALPEEQSITETYMLTSEELRMSGVLDELYERWNKTDSWPGSTASDDDNSSDLEGQGNDQEQEEAGDGWNDASAFNEEEIAEDVTGGWDAWEDRDTLCESANFEVKLSFERGEGNLFTFLNAYIEATKDEADEANALKKLRDRALVELRYHVNIEGRGSQDEPRLFPTQTSNSALGSEINMSIIEEWVRKLPPIAEASHMNALQVPARLIDLQANERLRIVDTSKLAQYSQGFAALSYVWGMQQTFILLTTNKDVLSDGFQIVQLPKTIQDAVIVTRRIGLRYLWIDALCIMQDSNEDKARELPKMRLIYKYAAVTIVAAVANSATEGFLHYIPDKAGYFIEPVAIPYRNESCVETQAYMILSYPADYKRSKDPINDRAWTFQELLLSTRAILFSYRGVQMIDRTAIPAADGLTSGKDPQLPSLPWSGQMFSLATNPENTRQVWLAARGEYSRRSLTHQSDKLLAIAAVAEELGRKYESNYLAGMWERDLAMDIQWSCPRDANMSGRDFVRKPRAEAYVAPSWSWASVDASVEDFVHVWEEEGKEGGEGIKDSLGFEVVSCEVELVVLDFAYGAVKSGILLVKGRLFSRIWRPHKHDDLHRHLESDGFLVSTQAENKLYSELTCGEATVDAYDLELHDGVEVMCLATRLIENVPGRDDVEGLMLLPVNEEQYRRVGFFRFNTPALFEDCEVEKVKII